MHTPSPAAGNTRRGVAGPAAGHGESLVCSAGSWLAWAEDFEDDSQQQRHAKEQADVAE